TYLILEYRAAASQPELQLRLEYYPPFLQVTWQNLDISARTADQIPEQHAVIDLRFAHFDPWNDGRQDRNVILVECWHSYPCYEELPGRSSRGRGEIGYLIQFYASEPIANALNYLASFHTKDRPKDRFE